MTLTKEVLDLFAINYSMAKEKFFASLKQCAQPIELSSVPIAEMDGDSHSLLSTEVVWLGAKDSGKVVVLISATHGVEGFVGAAVQTDLLRRIQQGYSWPEDTALLLIFALNPYGFEKLRRCDQSGIDLNRNFIDFSQAAPVNTGYAQLRETLFCADIALRHSKLQKFREQWGSRAFEIALSGGQYTDPYGPFYGGAAPSHGRNTIEQIIEHYQLAQRHLAVIDIHSGLGPYAHGEIINDHPPESSGFEVANRWYGASVTSPVVGDSSSVSKLGLLDFCWHPLMQQRGCFVTLEFGSYSIDALFEVIMEDHRSWQLQDVSAIHRSAAAMQEHFCPEDNNWRELVLVKSRQVIQQAIDGLSYE
jgi:predicted deacylase